MWGGQRVHSAFPTSAPPPPPEFPVGVTSPRSEAAQCVGGGGTRSTWVMEGVRGEGVRTPSGGKWGLRIGERCGG